MMLARACDRWTKVTSAQCRRNFRECRRRYRSFASPQFPHHWRFCISTRWCMMPLTVRYSTAGEVRISIF